MSHTRVFPGGRAGRALLLAAAVLVPCCLAVGWWGWSPVGDDATPGGGPTASPGDSPAASPTHASPGPSPRGDRPLAGTVVVLDPGHNPRNKDHTREIARPVEIGTGSKECDTTGTATSDGYPEAAFTLAVSRQARALLEQRGAEVVLTHDGARPYGPCVDERARIGNRERADAVVSVHADGAPVGNRGFHVILPARVRNGAANTARIIAPSHRLGDELAAAFQRATGSSPARYAGDGNGLTTRSDLGGLNLSHVPKVFVECGNMRDPKEAHRFIDPRWRDRAARGIADGITEFLVNEPSPPRRSEDTTRPYDGDAPDMTNTRKKRTKDLT